jgi:hypothetical protein
VLHAVERVTALADERHREDDAATATATTSGSPTTADYATDSCEGDGGADRAKCDGGKRRV